MNFIHYEKCKITRNRAVQQPFVLKVVAFNAWVFEILQMNRLYSIDNFKKFEHKKVGDFKKITRDQFLNTKGTENEVLRFWGISKNHENAITWQNHLSHLFRDISWYLPYEFFIWTNSRYSRDFSWGHESWEFFPISLQFLTSFAMNIHLRVKFLK